MGDRFLEMGNGNYWRLNQRENCLMEVLGGGLTV